MKKYASILPQQILCCSIQGRKFPPPNPKDIFSTHGIFSFKTTSALGYWYTVLSVSCGSWACVAEDRAVC